MVERGKFARLVVGEEVGKVVWGLQWGNLVHHHRGVAVAPRTQNPESRLKYLLLSVVNGDLLAGTQSFWELWALSLMENLLEFLFYEFWHGF